MGSGCLAHRDGNFCGLLPSAQGVIVATVITHRRTRIVTLERDEAILAHCHEGDIAIVQDDQGWWTNFVGENDEITGYDEPFESYNKALWTAKAVAEFNAS
jgi:hypothetical protein